MENEKAMPDMEQSVQAVDTETEIKPVPDTSIESREMPQVGNPENTVMIGGKLVEIKPTKMKYQRNRTAAFYHVLELYPLPDILAMNEKALGGRDGDKALCDWLVAVTDDEDLIRENYNEIDSETIYKLLAIFRRINRINEKEEKLKNVQAPGTKKG